MDTHSRLNKITHLSICLILSQVSFFSSIANMFGTSPELHCGASLSEQRWVSLIAGLEYGMNGHCTQ